MSKSVTFDTGNDFTTCALQARARGEKVASVLPPEVLKLIAEKPAPRKPAKARKAA